MAMNIRKMLIPVLLALSLIGNLAWLCISVAPKEEKSIIGTYCSEHANENLAKYGKYGDYLAAKTPAPMLLRTTENTWFLPKMAPTPATGSLRCWSGGPIAGKNPYSSWRKPPDTLTEKTRSSCLTDRRPLPIPALAMSRPISMCREKIDKKG